MLGVLDEQRSIKDAQAAEAILVMANGLPVPSLELLLQQVPGGVAALELLRADPMTRPESIGAVLREAYGVAWLDSTVRYAGTKFRAWARAAGVGVQQVSRKQQDKLTENMFV